MKYIKNGRIVMPDRIIDGKVLAYDGQISGYINAGDIPEGAEVIDAQGNYVCPGFVDIHIHGYLNEDTSDGNPEGIRKMAYGIAENGVTSFLPTTMTVSEEEIVAALNAVRSLKKESETWGGAQFPAYMPLGRLSIPRTMAHRRKSASKSRMRNSFSTMRT